MFRVRQVQVVGTHLPVSEIVQAAGVSGRNIFTVRSDAVVEQVSTIPQIVVERVMTTFPDTVSIYARARIPMVGWRPTKGKLFLLDPNGMVIEAVRATTLPVIVGSAPGGRLGSGVVAAVRFAVEALRRVPNGAIALFRFGPRTGLVIVGRAGWRAELGRGTPQTLVNRVAALEALLRTIGNRPLLYVDLRYRTPYATFAGSSG
jgi:cell division septal protein FtsQ